MKKYSNILDEPLEVELTGPELLASPLLNKGTAFTEEERDEFCLHGFLPPHIGTLEEQVSRRMQALRSYQKNLSRYLFLRGLQDLNETLFYSLVTKNLNEVLPVVYTPTVGEGCQDYSRIFAKPRGLFLSYPYRRQIREILSHRRFDKVEAIVVSDGERILGLGDQGAGGMGIPIGKLSLYTACAGLNPETTLPILLDVGTDNQERLADPLYIGWRHERIRGQEYDDFIEAFVSAVEERWSHVLLQWEDFARANAGRLLERYRNRLCTFNDDIQGTAAVAAGTLLSAINVTGIPLTEQRIVIVGAGSAGAGIASLIKSVMIDAGLTEQEARRRFFAVDRDGLLIEGMSGIFDFQKPFVHPLAAIDGWLREHPDKISLYDVVRNTQPTVLIGVSAQPGIFNETIVRTMAASVERPIIFPLSNPTSRAEATPENLNNWTAGRAVIGTGSPFPPVERNGKLFTVDQTNNTYIFPGLGLGALAVKARIISDEMFKAAAKTLVEMSPARFDPEANLLPPIADLRKVARRIAQVVAEIAVKEGLCEPIALEDIPQAIENKMWEPLYRPYKRKH